MTVLRSASFIPTGLQYVLCFMYMLNRKQLVALYDATTVDNAHGGMSLIYLSGASVAYSPRLMH